MSEPASIRTHMLRLLHLPATVGLQVGIVSSQVVALKSGADVVLTREQLSMFGHPDMPADLDEHAEWTLTGDSTLTAVE